jgi:hypothetical protein
MWKFNMFSKINLTISNFCIVKNSSKVTVAPKKNKTFERRRNFSDICENKDFMHHQIGFSCVAFSFFQNYAKSMINSKQYIVRTLFTQRADDVCGAHCDATFII